MEMPSFDGSIPCGWLPIDALEPAGWESDHASRRVVSSTSAFGQGAQVLWRTGGFHPENLTPVGFDHEK